MAANFMASEWADAWWERMRASEDLRMAGATWAHGPMAWNVLAAPDKNFPNDSVIAIDIHEGDVRNVQVGESGGLAPITLTGGFLAWKDLLSGTDDIVDAVLTSRIQLRGDITLLTRHRQMFVSMLAAARTVETVWQDEAVAEAAASN
jgi:putative sterol carrier protein